MQATVDGDNLAGGFVEALRYQEEEGFRLVRWSDRFFGERAIGVESRELRGQRFR